MLQFTLRGLSCQSHETKTGKKPAVTSAVRSTSSRFGAFLVSMRNGDGETSGEYHTVYWRRDDFAARLESAGLVLIRDDFNVGRDREEWSTFLAVRPA